MIIQYQWIRVHNTFNNRLTEAIDEGPGASDPSGKTPDRWGREPSKKCLRAAIVEVRNSSGKRKVLNNRKRKQTEAFNPSKHSTSSAVTQWRKMVVCIAKLGFCNITQFKGISFSGFWSFRFSRFSLFIPVPQKHRDAEHDIPTSSRALSVKIYLMANGCIRDPERHAFCTFLSRIPMSLTASRMAATPLQEKHGTWHNVTRKIQQMPSKSQ